MPGPNDPRTPTGRPFVDYPLQGDSFIRESSPVWRWTVEGGPCDQFAGTNTGYQLINASNENALFRRGCRVARYLRVRHRMENSCAPVIDVLGPGLRVEMCYPESYTQDLDLYMMPVSRAEDWFRRCCIAAWWNQLRWRVA